MRNIFFFGNAFYALYFAKLRPSFVHLLLDHSSCLESHVRTIPPIEGTRSSHRGSPLQLHRNP